MTSMTTPATTVAFPHYLGRGYKALEADDLPGAYAAFEHAHVLGQRRTMRHVCSHIAFWRWAVQAGIWREALRQLGRVQAALLITWLWMPQGNTGGARISALRTMPITDELQPCLEHSR